MVPKRMGFPLQKSKDIEQRKLMKKKRERKKNSPVITVKKPQQSYSRTGREEEKLSLCECREITVDSSESQQSGLAFDG